MAQLIVRKVDEEVVRALRMRAASHNRSSEAEHRELLREALFPAGLSGGFFELLSSIPPVGSDRDFRRNKAKPRKTRIV